MCKTTTRVLLWSLFVLLHQTVWSQSRPTFQEIELTQELVEVGGQTMVKIKAKGGHKFSWNTGATTQSIEVSLRSKDRYTVEVEESDGRKSSISTSLALPALLSTQRSRSTINQLAPEPVDPGCPSTGIGGYYSRICSGTTLTLVASGGTSYRWENGATTSSITVSPVQGNNGYRVTITYVNPQDKSQTCTEVKSTGPIEVVPQPSASILGGNLNVCGSLGIGTLSAEAGQGITGATFLWSTGETTKTINVATPATASFGVKVSTGNGLCSSEASTTIKVTPFSPNIQGSSQICLGTGTVLTATGGSTFKWDNNSTSSSRLVTPSDVGTHVYTVTITSGDCNAVRSHAVTVTPAPTATILGPDKACYNGSVTLTASGTGTYKWSTGATSSSISPSLLQSNQTYGLTITDPITKCASSDEHVVNVLQVPTLTATPNSICAGASVNLSVSGGSSYSWNVGGATASIVHSPSATTEYRVTVTDANGCVYSLSKTVNVNAPPNISFGGGTSVCAGQSLNVTAFGGQSYRWDYNNATTATIMVSPTQNTTYTVTATSSEGCVASAQRAISIKPTPQGKIDALGSMCTGQSVTLIASGGSSYRWKETNASTASITVSPTQNTTYTVSITNTEGCTMETSYNVFVNISGTVSNDGPLTCSKTTVMLQGASAAQGASYRWKNASGASIATTASTSVAAPGVYTLEITGAGGCTYTTSTEVLQNRQIPTVSASNSGTITCTQSTVNLTGTSSASSASYEWRNGSGTLLASTLNASTTQAGTYTLKVTAANGCSNTASTTVTADVATPQASIQQDGPLTCTKTTVTLTAVSGTPNLQYTWRNAAGTSIGSNVSSIVVSSAGTYQLEARGSNGCATTSSTTITQGGNLPNISVSPNASISCIAPETTVSGNSSTAGVSYAWYNPNGRLMTTQKSFITNMGGTYTLKVTSAEGCVSTASTTISESVFSSQAITLNVGGVYTDNSFAEGELSCIKNKVVLSASARFAGYSASVYWTTAGGQVLSWQNSLTVSNPGYYYLRQNGCSLMKEILIKDKRVLEAKIRGEDSVCVGKNTVLIASGGSSYTWSTGETTASISTAALSNASTYSVSVSQGNCNATASHTIGIKKTPVIRIDGPAGTCAGSAVTLTALGGVSYLWSTGATGSQLQVSPQETTTYTLSGTGSNGCTGRQSHTLNVGQPWVYVESGSETICPGQTATVTVYGSAGATLSYQVNNAAVQTLLLTGASQKIQVSGLRASGTLRLTKVERGCAVNLTQAIPIWVYDTVRITSNNGTVCRNGTAVFTIQGPARSGLSYQLNDNPVVTTYLSTGTQTLSFANVSTTATLRLISMTSYDYYGNARCVTPLNQRSTVTVVDAPQVSVSQNGPLGCSRPSVTLSASSTAPGAQQYVWKDAAGTSTLGNTASIQVTTAGVYRVELTASNGCKNTASITVLEDGSFPNVSIDPPATLQCGAPYTSTLMGRSSTPQVSYQWTAPNGQIVGNQFSYVAQVKGKYTLKVTTAGGCSKSASVEVLAAAEAPFDLSLNNGVAKTEAIITDTLTCNKSSIQISALQKAGVYYQWNAYLQWSSATNAYLATGPNLTITQPGIYRVYYAYVCNLKKEIHIIDGRTAPTVSIKGDTVLCQGESTSLTASGGVSYAWSTGATTATLTTATLNSSSTYTVTVTGSNGCKKTRQVLVKVEPIPTASVVLNSGPICSGSTATFTVKGTAGSTLTYRLNTVTGLSLSLTGSNQLISIPNASENQTLTLLSVNTGGATGCTSTLSASSTVVVNSLPVATITGGDIACRGESTLLTASGGSSYLWSNNATTSSISISQPTQDQTYSVTVSNGPNCFDVASKTVVVPAALTLSHDLAGHNDCIANNVTVIPTVSGGTESVTLSLFRSGEGNPLPSLNGLKSGTYLLKAQDSKGCTAQREVVIAETPLEISSLTLSKVDDCIPGNTQLNISTKGDRLPLVYRLDGVVQSGATITLPREEKTYRIEVSDAAGCVGSREEYYEDYDAVRVTEISPVTDCSTPNGAIHFAYVAKPGSSQSNFSLSVDGGTTWHQGVNKVGNLRPGLYQTAARNDLAGCVVQGPQVQINAPDCLPEAGFTKSTLHITSPTQRIALPWRVDKRAWGNADKPFSLRIYRVEDGKPHFVDPNIATATEPLEKSVEPGAGFTIEYAVDFAGSDERELVLQPNAKDHLEPGFYTFLMEGEGVDVDPFRKEIKVIVDLDGRVIVTPIDGCPGIDITLTVNEGECWNWEGLNQPNQRTITVKHVQGRIYTVNYLENLVKKTQVFIGDNEIEIPIELSGYEESCPGISSNVSWRYKDLQSQYGDGRNSVYAADWKVQWLPNPTSKPDPNFSNFINITPTQTTTYKIKVTYVPTGCTFELGHTVKVEDLFEKAGIKAKESTKLSCTGGDVILDVENPQNINLNYKWYHNGSYLNWNNPPLKVSLPGKYTVDIYWQGKHCSKTIEFEVVANDPCEIKKYFESNGFYAIPINIHSRPQVKQAELREPCQDSGEKVKDDAGMGFDLRDDSRKESIDLKGIFESSLSHFSSCFGYTSSQALISENTDICSCDDYLPKAEERMQKSGLQYWSHVFEGQDCGGQDYLFIKAKMPDGSEYGSNGADFLNAGLNYALQVAQNKGGRMGMGLILDHMLDNFVEAKTATVFSQTPPQKLPEPKKELETLFQPSCVDGKNFISANVFAADGKLIQLPPETVWRFDIDSKVKVTSGVLTGYTLFKDDALIGIYTGRKKINTEEFLGYYLRGASTNICTPETFKAPDRDDNGFLYVDVGKLVKQRFVDYANCGQSFEISLVHMSPNIKAFFSPSGTVTPRGTLFTGEFSDLALTRKGVLQYSSKPVYSYSICPEALGDVAPDVGTDYSRLGVNLFYNAAESSVMYQIKDSKGNPLWLYVRAEPGTYVNGCQDKFTYYIWNCKIATWQEINPNDPTFKNDCELIQKLFKALENSQLLHKTLSDVSFIPIVGDIASLANGIIYLAEGDIGRGKTELFWAVVGVAGELIPLGGAALRLVAKTVDGALSPGIARIIAIVKLVPCDGAPSLVETELLGPCRIPQNILTESRTNAMITKLQELGFKFGDATTKLMTDFIHNNRLGSAFHTWLKDANVEHLAVIFKTGLEDLKWPVTKLEDLVDDLMRIPGLLKKMAENSNLIKAWDVLSASPIFRQNEVYLERLASLGFDWAKLKSSFATALSKADEAHVRKWMELKIPKTDLEKTYQNGLNDIPSEYTPFTPEHKAQRWEQHKLEKEAKGETPNYETWSNTYDGNIDKAAIANKGLDDYYNANGWKKPPVYREYSISDVGPVITSKGKTVTGGRRFDIYDEIKLKAIEYKEYTGTVYKSEDIEIEALKDAFSLQNNPKVKSVDWVFKGCTPSGPLRELLIKLKIDIIELP